MTTNTPKHNSHIRDWIMITISVANLIILVYLAQWSAGQQKALEEFKSNLTLTKLTYSYSESTGIVTITNTGARQAFNVQATVYTRGNTYHRQIVSTTPHITPTAQYNTENGELYQFNIGDLAPQQFSRAAFFHEESDHPPTSTDIAINVYCNNCTDITSSLQP